MDKITRTDARKYIMTILYQAFLYSSNKQRCDIESVINQTLPMDNEFVRQIVYGVLEHKKELYTIANENLTTWNMSRLGLTDQAIMCMGIYELLYVETPSIISINEAVELAKEYSDDKVKDMINAVLDKIYRGKLDNE